MCVSNLPDKMELEQNIEDGGGKTWEGKNFHMETKDCVTNLIHYPEAKPWNLTAQYKKYLSQR